MKRILCLLIALLFPGTALAGGTLIDGRNPMGKGVTEVQIGVEKHRWQGKSYGSIPRVELNHGLTDDLDIQLVGKSDFRARDGQQTKYHFGDGQLGFRYRFINVDGFSAAFAPFTSLPTGAHDQGFGTHKPRQFFPIWLKQEFGDAQVYGGGGIARDPNAQANNFGHFGVGAKYRFLPEFGMLAEIYHQTPKFDHGVHMTAIDVGAVYNFTEATAVTFVVGKGIQNQDQDEKTYLHLSYSIRF